MYDYNCANIKKLLYIVIAIRLLFDVHLGQIVH